MGRARMTGTYSKGRARRRWRRCLFSSQAPIGPLGELIIRSIFFALNLIRICARWKLQDATFVHGSPLPETRKSKTRYQVYDYSQCRIYCYPEIYLSFQVLP